MRFSFYVVKDFDTGHSENLGEKYSGDFKTNVFTLNEALNILESLGKKLEKNEMLFPVV